MVFFLPPPRNQHNTYSRMLKSSELHHSLLSPNSFLQSQPPIPLLTSFFPGIYSIFSTEKLPLTRMFLKISWICSKAVTKKHEVMTSQNQPWKAVIGRPRVTICSKIREQNSSPGARGNRVPRKLSVKEKYDYIWKLDCVINFRKKWGYHEGNCARKMSGN